MQEKQQNDNMTMLSVRKQGCLRDALKLNAVKTQLRKNQRLRVHAQDNERRKPSRADTPVARFANGQYVALGERKLGPYKTRTLPNVVQVVF